MAIDPDRESLAWAKTAPNLEPNIMFIQGGLLEHPLPEESFDFVVAVATLHHLPLRLALDRFRCLLRSGGTLVIVGLFRLVTPTDYVMAAAALPISRTLRCIRGQAEVGAPVAEPTETLREIRAECNSSLPGGTFRRRLFFRYSFIWRKP